MTIVADAPITPASTAPPKDLRTIALIGHPNVGKSVIFHALTGKYVTVSNFPGTTVDLSTGVGTWDKSEWAVVDSPGVVSLQPKTEDERVARNLIVEKNPDVVIQVADAKNLAKTLQLTLELAEFGRPVVLALNMMDEAEDRGVSIDVKRLSHLLGIPVVATVAITGDGIKELKAAVKEAKPIKVRPRYDAQLEIALKDLESPFGNTVSFKRALTVALLLKEPSAATVTEKFLSLPELNAVADQITAVRTRFVRSPEMLVFEAKHVVVQEILGEVLSLQKNVAQSWLGRLGNLCMRPFPGYAIALGVLWILYEFVGVFGADTLVGFLEDTVFGATINPAATKLITALIPVPFLQEAIVGPYGVVTMALTYALALILPIVTTFFLFFSFLEDSGYLPRLAVMMDRFFRMMGLNGRAVLPMVLGLGCDTMATVTTRILDTKKEKVILSLLLTLSVPCSAQLAAIFGMSGGMSWKVLAIWFAVVAGTMLLVGWGASRLLPGSRAPLLLEIPPLRWPKISNIFKKVKARLKWYLKEVIPLFVLATFVLFLLDKLTLLKKMNDWASPVVVHFLGLPAKATEAFLVGFFRRDYGAAGFFALAKDGLMTPQQVTVSMAVITLFMPCIAHVLMTIKERGLRVSAYILGFVLTFSLLVGGALNWLLTRTAWL